MKTKNITCSKVRTNKTVSQTFLVSTSVWQVAGAFALFGELQPKLFAELENHFPGVGRHVPDELFVSIIVAKAGLCVPLGHLFKRVVVVRLGLHTDQEFFVEIKLAVVVGDESLQDKRKIE